MLPIPALLLSLVLAALPRESEIEYTILSSAALGAGLWEFRTEGGDILQAEAAAASMAGVLSLGDAQSQVYRCRFDMGSATPTLVGCDATPGQ